MTIRAHRLTDLNDPIQKFLITDFMQQMRDQAFQLTFLDSDGGTTGGRKCYNFDAVWVNYVSNGTANTEDTVAHNLGRVPNGIIVGVPDKAAVIYDGDTTWTSTSIYLKASAATVTVNLVVF